MNFCVIPKVSGNQCRRPNCFGPYCAFHGPSPLPCFLAVCLNFHTCTGKRPRLTGGENAHVFPVVSELGTAIKAHYIRSRLRCSFTTALSPFAGLGKTDAFVPASEQSVKDLHKSPPGGCFQLQPATFGTYLGPQFLRHPNHKGSAPSYLLNSAGRPLFVSLVFPKPDDKKCHLFIFQCPAFSTLNAGTLDLLH
jgi:hypothetical protein